MRFVLLAAIVCLACARASREPTRQAPSRPEFDQAKQALKEKYGKELGIDNMHGEDEENVDGFLEELLEKELPQAKIDAMVKDRLESFGDMDDDDVQEELKTFERQSRYTHGDPRFEKHDL